MREVIHPVRSLLFKLKFVYYLYLMAARRKIQPRCEGRLISLQDFIETIYRNLDKSVYYDRQFDKQFIAALTRKELKKKGITTKWDDRKVYELAFNAIQFFNISLPKYRKLAEKYNIKNADMAAAFGFKDAESFRTAANKHRIVSHFISSATLILSKIA